MGKVGKLIKRANEIAEGYQEARDNEFGKQFNDAFPQPNMATEEDVQEFMTKFDEDYPHETD